MYVFTLAGIGQNLVLNQSISDSICRLWLGKGKTGRLEELKSYTETVLFSIYYVSHMIFVHN